MNFKPQCTTQAELFREAARVSEMCAGTEVKIWDCVKHDGKIRDHLTFDDTPEYYEFFLDFVEGKPVFWGDELYDDKGIKRIICGYNKLNGQLLLLWEVPDAIIPGLCEGLNANKFSWNPPKPRL